ncbi:MAG: InlB B-repeat-containing protein [Candidatus Methanodesulfokora washburnensis]|jgi:hypothetical protein
MSRPKRVLMAVLFILVLVAPSTSVMALPDIPVYDDDVVPITFNSPNQYSDWLSFDQYNNQIVVVDTIAQGVCHYLEYWKNKYPWQLNPDVTDYVCPSASGWGRNRIVYHTQSSQTTDYVRIKTDTTQYTGTVYFEKDSVGTYTTYIGKYPYTFRGIVEAIQNFNLYQGVKYYIDNPSDDKFLSVYGPWSSDVEKSWKIENAIIIVSPHACGYFSVPSSGLYLFVADAGSQQTSNEYFYLKVYPSSVSISLTDPSTGTSPSAIQPFYNYQLTCKVQIPSPYSDGGSGNVEFWVKPPNQDWQKVGTASATISNGVGSASINWQSPETNGDYSFKCTWDGSDKVVGPVESSVVTLPFTKGTPCLVSIWPATDTKMEYGDIFSASAYLTAYKPNGKSLVGKKLILYYWPPGGSSCIEVDEKYTDSSGYAKLSTKLKDVGNVYFYMLFPGDNSWYYIYTNSQGPYNVQKASSSMYITQPTDGSTFDYGSSISVTAKIVTQKGISGATSQGTINYYYSSTGGSWTQFCTQPFSVPETDSGFSVERSCTWNPPAPGTYYLIANWQGNEHYGPSEATPVKVNVVIRYQVIVDPNGGRIYVDGTPITSVQTYSWVYNSQHTLDPDSGYQPSSGVRKIFTQWSDGSTADPRTITVTGPATYVAYWKTQYQLTISSSDGGTTNPAPGSSWYDSGSSVSVTAIPSSGYAFDHWELDGTNVGSANPYTVNMDKPHTLKAVFTASTSLDIISIVRGMDNSIYYKTCLACSYIKLSGSTSDSPSAVYLNGKLYIAVRGMDGSSIYFGFLSSIGSSSISWQKLPGSTPSRPSLTTDGSKLYLVVRGGDNGIYVNVYDIASGKWAGWKKLTGSTVRGPSSAFLNGKLHLVVVGSDGKSIYYGQVDPSTFKVNWSRISGSTDSEPSLTTDGSKLYLVVKGLNSRVYVNTWSGSWIGWECVPTGSTPSGPASAFRQNLYIFVRGMDSRIYYAYRIGANSYSSWKLLGGSSQSSPAATAGP